MKLNLKVRLKNPTFWLTFIPSILALVYTILASFDIVPRISESTLTELLAIVISLLTSIGVLNDPTTSGLSDSNRAMTYDAPFVSEFESSEDRKGDEE